ncbi:MAG: nucleotidyltransferase domain-containing protein [Alkalispirochaeta sp.]
MQREPAAVWRNGRLADLHRQAKADAERIVAFISDIYRPTRILQWGSVLEPELFREYSDIDIAVEGITDAETFFSLLSDAEKMTEFPVDIVQLERIEPEFRELLMQKGLIVYER